MLVITQLKDTSKKIFRYLDFLPFGIVPFELYPFFLENLKNHYVIFNDSINKNINIYSTVTVSE